MAMEHSPGELGHDRSNRALAHQNRILRQIANDDPLGELLESICEYGNVELPEAITSIQSADHSGTFLQFTAGSRARSIHAHVGNSMPISPRADWCGLAAYRREPVIVADTATHASWTKHRAFAREFQIAACWVIPILDTRPGEGNAPATTRATITVYRRCVGEPDADATATLATMSEMARMAIERNQARRALIESETRQRLLFDHASDAMFLHDATGTILDVNRQACALLRASRAELLGTSPADFDLDLDAARLDDVVARMDRGELVAFESRFRRRDGTEFPVEVRTASFFARERRYTIGLIRDLTDVRAAQQALREQAAMLRRAHEIAQLNSWTYDVTRRTWGLGEPGSTLLGTPRTDRQPSISDLLAEVHEADRSRVADAWRRGLAGQRLDIACWSRARSAGDIRLPSWIARRRRGSPAQPETSRSAGR